MSHRSKEKEAQILCRRAFRHQFHGCEKPADNGANWWGLSSRKGGSLVTWLIAAICARVLYFHNYASESRITSSLAQSPSKHHPTPTGSASAWIILSLAPELQTALGVWVVVAEGRQYTHWVQYIEGNVSHTVQQNTSLKLLRPEVTHLHKHTYIVKFPMSRQANDISVLPANPHTKTWPRAPGERFLIIRKCLSLAIKASQLYNQFCAEEAIHLKYQGRISREGRAERSLLTAAVNESPTLTGAWRRYAGEPTS